MKYNELQATANKNKKRVGRGISAGQGKTAGRGTKGQGARTGKKLAASFQGGQRALVQAIPKNRGFKSLRTPAQVVYMDCNTGSSQPKDG
jgi:large subunit ribosomal protein L15